MRGLQGTKWERERENGRLRLTDNNRGRFGGLEARPGDM